MQLGVAAWLDRPTQKVGLDNLGTQQPSVFIYSRLLPGVTNVTDRAHYFAFYPWFVCAFEARYPKAPDTKFREWLRRADCLVTLIAERHAAHTGDADVDRHAGACPGRLKLRPAAAELARTDAQLKLSTFTNRSETNKKRYFKNPLGGLGQYYLGQLRDEYEALRGDARKGVKYTKEVGKPLAESAAHGVPEDAFFAAIEKDEIGASDLDALSAFCPCALSTAARARVHAALKALMLDSATPNGLARRRSFDLLLSFFQDAAPIATGAAKAAELVDAEAAEYGDDAVRAFLKACYANRLSSGAPWMLGRAHEETRQGWALYARNEMMSLAWMAIFKLCLDALNEAPIPTRNVGALCEELLERDLLSWRPAEGFDGLVAHDRANGPAIGDGENPDHEFQLWARLSGTDAPNLEDAVRLLVRLVARFGDEEACYARAGVPGQLLGPYPLTLDTLNMMARRLWSGLDARTWLKALMVETFVAHQRVAVRKMGQSGEDTLMVRANDVGYFVHRPQEIVVSTQPRLRQAIQILRDLDFVRFPDAGLPVLTSRGVTQLEAMSP